MGTMYQERPRPAPVLTPGDGPYCEAAASGRPLIKRCRSCGEAHFYPRALCPFCQSEQTEWEVASGRRQIYAFSITRRAGPIPYAIAFVTLEEGVTMMTNIVDCDLDSIRIGQAVEVVFKPTESGQPVPCFKPVD